MQHAASTLGLDLAVLKRAKARGCSAFDAGSRVNRPRLLAWLKDHPVEMRTATSREELECRRLKAVCERLEGALARDRADFVAKAVLGEHLTRFAAEVSATMASKESALPELLAGFGLDAAGLAAAQRALKAHVCDPILERFHAHFDQFIATPG